MQIAALTPKVHFVETSEALRAKQKANVPDAAWHHDLDSLPTKGPLLVAANEFFDALPVRQMVATPHGWRERVVIKALNGEAGAFEPMAGYRPMDSAVPDAFRHAPEGAILESSPARATIAYAQALRLGKQGGAAPQTEEGYEGPALGDTLQAVRGHQAANPFAAPCASALPVQVAFITLCTIA